MTQILPQTPGPEELRRHVKAMSSVRGRKKPSSNIWFFDSPKTGRREIITGDLAFVTFVLLEFDLAVARYEVSPGEVAYISGNEQRQLEPGAFVHFEDQHSEWWDFRYSRHGDNTSLEAAKEAAICEDAASQRKMRHRIVTELDVRSKSLLFDNSLLLCSAISRCRKLHIQREMDLLLESIRVDSVSARHLFSLPDSDKAQMLAAIAISLQSGVANTKLETELFGLDSLLHRGRL